MAPSIWTSKGRIFSVRLHGLSRGGEDLGQGLVHRLLDALVLALAAVLRELAAAFQVGVVALVVGRLLVLALLRRSRRGSRR